MLPARDFELVQIVTTALADAAARAVKGDGSSWLACHAGCTPCCHGVFKISMLDAERLRSALEHMAKEDPSRAEAIQLRARDVVLALKSTYPGDPSTGLLGLDEDAWEAFADRPESDLPCPALHPITGTCELYEARPLTCRVFGPPIVSQTGVGLCELCYVGADHATILAGKIALSHIELERELDEGMPPGETVIPWVLATSR